MKKSRLTLFMIFLALVGGFLLQSCIKTNDLDELMESQTIHDTIYVAPAVKAPALIYGYVINLQGIHRVYGFNNKLACYGGNDIFGNFTYDVIWDNSSRLTMKWAYGSIVADYYLTFTSKDGGTYTGVLTNVAYGKSYGVWNTNFSEGEVSGTFTIYVP